MALQLDPADTKTFDSFAGLAQQLLKDQWQTEHFDFLVNNAGTGVHSSFAETTEEDFDHLMNVHVKGVFFLTQKLLSLINDGGRIVNVSTGLTRIISPGYAAYARTQASAMTRTVLQRLSCAAKKSTEARVLRAGGELL